MGIEDRDWRKEEIRQQRHANKSQSNKAHQANSLSVEQFLSNNLKNQKLKPRASKKPIAVIILFLLILLASGGFLIYQFFPIPILEKIFY